MEMFEELLLEKKLTTDFTMGFELEGCWLDRDADDDDILEWFNEHLGKGGEVHYDGSLHTSRYRGGRTFEFASPVLPVNVGSLQKILNMYKEGLDKVFYTNPSCGYHHHISFPGITADDMVWIMCNLALDDRQRSLISDFEGIEFVHEEWAKDEYLDDLRSAVENLDYTRIASICDTEKYSLVNVHYHNTLEWRGPRGVLDEGEESKELILLFYKRFWNFVNWMTIALDKKEINGVDKQNFMDGVRTSTKMRDIKGFRFKTEHKPGVLSKETLDKMVNEIINNPVALLKYATNKGGLLEQLVQELYNKNRLGTRIKRLFDEGHADEMSTTLCDICVKYIPYRMMKQFPDKITSDSITNMSKITFKRLLATSRLDGNTVTLNDKITLLTEYRDKLKPALFARNDSTEILYLESSMQSWELKHLPLLTDIFYQNNYMQSFDKPVLFADYLANLLSGIEDEQTYVTSLKILLTIFGQLKGSTNVIAKNLIKQSFKFPKVIIPFLNLKEDGYFYLISYVRENHPESLPEIANALISSGKLSQEQYDEMIVELRKDEAGSLIDNPDIESFDDDEIDTSVDIQD